MSEYVITQYMRLSLDDKVTDSLSISNQHLLLNKYIDDMEIPNVTIMEFIDNGYTGTNMERPALQEMLELVRCGKVNCIIVKDFSRFSRNALESGYYIEQVFPLYRVRFISVSDGFDSNDYKDDTGGIDVAFKFLLHEYYSQDLSKKVKSAKHIKMKRGEYITANAIYGYRKNDAGTWKPDEDAAEIVQKIFRLTLEGMSSSAICNELFRLGHPTPREYMDLKCGKSITPKCLWAVRNIRHILTNEQYIGTYISGKQRSDVVGSRQTTKLGKSEWIMIPDSHPPIISKNDFMLAQDIINAKTEAVFVKRLWEKEANSPEEPPKKKVIPSTPIYGYRKSINGDLELDTPAAKIVAEIFDMALNGLSTTAICDSLIDSGYPTPREHIKLANGRKITTQCIWKADIIRDILRKIEYTGAYVSGKSKKDLNTGKYLNVPKEEWNIIPDTCPAIVTKEIFEKVRLISLSRKNAQKGDYLLRGKVICGCCEHALSHERKSNFVYSCYYTLPNPTALCYKFKISAAELDEVVLCTIKAHAEAILNLDSLSDLRKVEADSQQLVDVEKQVKHLIEQRQSHYERYVTREIDKDTYQALRADCNAQLERLNTQISLHKQAEQNRQARQKTRALAQTVVSESASTKDIVDMLVDKVYVFPNNHVEIRWKVSGF